MSEIVIYETYGGLPWTPQFVEKIDSDLCMGCGRCVKLCVQKCLGFESFEDDEGTERHIAIIANKDKCIGCRACGSICVKKCHSFKEKIA